MIIVKCLREFPQKFENIQCFCEIMKANLAFEFILSFMTGGLCFGLSVTALTYLPWSLHNPTWVIDTRKSKTLLYEFLMRSKSTCIS